MVEHMANPSAYIQSSRHHVYYFRIRVPLHLQTQLRQTYIRRSLLTTAKQMAFHPKVPFFLSFAITRVN